MRGHFLRASLAGAVGGGGYDTDAAAYIAAVEAEDGQSLEVGVADAINDFVVGCKADGIWSAIKASCILAGARTLDGCLVPLVGAAPTRFNFVAGDYHRETGLKGNGSNKYLNTNRAGNVDPLNSHHISSMWSSIGSSALGIMSDREANSGTSQTTLVINAQTSCRGATGGVRGALGTLQGISRSGATSWQSYAGGVFANETSASTAASTNTCKVFCRGDVQFFTDGRCQFYSIGEHLNLALLDARVTTLMTDIAAAIP